MILKNRQEAIDVVAHAIWHYPNHNFLNVYDKAYELAEYALRQVVLAEPERKTGRWIVSDDKDWHTCPVCDADIDVSMGTGIYVDNDEVNHVNYCPNCGCKMEVEE